MSAVLELLKEVQVGDRLLPLRLWNDTTRLISSKLPAVCEVIAVKKHNNIQFGVAVKVYTQTGIESAWLSIGWFAKRIAM